MKPIEMTTHPPINPQDHPSANHLAENEVLDRLLAKIKQMNAEGSPAEHINPLIEEAIELAYCTNEKRRLMLVRYQQVNLHFRLSQYPQATVRAREIYEYARANGDTELIYMSLGIIAGVQAMVGSYADALGTFYQLLSLIDHSEDLRQYRGLVLHNVGSVYLRAKDWSQALEHYAVALQTFQTARVINWEHHVISTYENMSLVYAQQRQGEGALNAAMSAIQFSEQCGLPVKNTTFLYAGKAYQLLGDTDAAQACFERAKHATTGTIGAFFTGMFEQYSGDLAGELGAYVDALAHLECALAAFSTLNTRREMLDVRESLYRLHKQYGDHARALEQFEAYSVLKEELFNEQTDVRLKTIQAMHDVETARLERKAEHERNEALNRELDERDRVISALDGYAHTVAHDIKNPLNVIYGASNLLLDFGSQLDDEQRQQSLELIFSSCEQCFSIVDSLLEMAQMRRQAFTPARVDMESVVHSAINRLRDLIQQRRAVVDVAGDLPCALGTANWLEQVWVNLISNAVKYGGISNMVPPRIYISAVMTGDFVRYGVHDNGGGITPEEQTRLFGTFVRLERHSEVVEGHGLGLNIVKTIIEKLGGQVWIESSGIPGEGSAFYFTLPAAR